MVGTHQLLQNVTDPVISTMQVALLGQGKAGGRLVVLVQALTSPTLVAAATAHSQPAGSFVHGADVPAVIQVSSCHMHHFCNLQLLL